MAITQAQFLSDPNHYLRVFAKITVPRASLAAAWTNDGTHTNTWRIAWPPSEHNQRHKVRPSGVQEWNGSAFVDLTEVTSASDCNSTNASWYYDRSNSRVYHNPTGALASLLRIKYPFRAGTEDFPGLSGVAVTEGGVVTEAVQYLGCIKTKPAFTHEIGFLDTVARIGDGSTPGGSLEIVDGYNQTSETYDINMAARLASEDWIGAPIEIYVQGKGAVPGVPRQELAWANKKTVFSGVVTAVSGSPQTGIYSITFADQSVYYSATLAPRVDITGYPDDIISTACGAASPTVTAPSLESGFTTQRDYYGCVGMQETTRLIDIISAAAAPLLCFYITRAGTPTLGYWRLPDSGETIPATFREGETANLSREISVDYLYSDVQLFAGTATPARRTAKQKPSRNEKSNGGERDDNYEIKTVSYSSGGGSGWTAHAVATNTFYRTWDLGGDIVEVTENDKPLAKEGSINGCDTNDESWTLVTNDGATSGQPIRLYVNPDGGFSMSGSSGRTYIVKYKIEKQRSSPSGGYSGSTTSAGDINYKTASNALTRLRYGRKRLYQLQTCITNASHLDTAAGAILDFLELPFEFWTFEAPLADALKCDVNQTIKFVDRDGTSIYLRLLSLADDYQTNRARIRAFRQVTAAAV